MLLGEGEAQAMTAEIREGEDYSSSTLILL